MELPYVFRTTLATIPRDVPYLYAAPLATAAPLRPDATRVGIFWRVGDWDDRRAVPYDFVEPIAGLDGVEACMVPRTPPGALGIPTWTLLHAEPDWRWRWVETTVPGIQRCGCSGRIGPGIGAA